MKKFLLGFAPLLLVLLSAIPAKALTLQWDNPGAIEVRTSLNDASSAIAIDPTATQIELTESRQYYIRPAVGYKLLTCDVVSGGTSKFNISNNGNGQFVSVSQYYNGYSLKFTTEKMVKAGSITVNVVNGADKITGQLINSQSKLSNNTPVTFKEGEQTIDITNYDNVLYIAKANGVSLQSIYSVKLNGEEQKSTSAYYPQYNVPIASNDKIEIQVYDPDNMPKEYTATFKFANGDDKALTGVYNATAMAAKFYDQLVKDNWMVKYEGNTRLRLNFNEDYVISAITANGTPLDFEADDTSVNYTITGDTEFVITAKVREYEAKTALVYITDPEGVTFLQSFDDEAAPLTLTEATPANGVTMGKYAVPDGTKAFTISDINAKTGTIFFNIKDGYFLKLAACANPEYPTEEDANNITYLNAWNSENGPFFMDIRKIENTAKAVVAYVGDANVVRVQSETATGDVVPCEGLPANLLTAGYSTISFDPAYNDHFKARLVGDTDKQLYVYLDGTACAADDNGVFQTLKVADGSLLKIFLAASAPENNRVNFTVADGLQADVVYDKIKTHADLSQPLVSRGATLVEITPKQPCTVKVAGTELKADDNGVYAFTTSALITRVELSAPAAKPLEVKSTSPAEGAEVKSFSSATVSLAMPNGNFVLADAEKISTITVKTPAGESIAATGAEMTGEPSESAGISYQITFPAQTADGKYVLTVPAGVFYETEWSDTAGDFVAKAGGAVNDVITVNFSISAQAGSVFDKYVTTPADGAAVRSISTVKVTFPNVASMMPVDAEVLPEITLTNGTTTYTGSAMTDWNSYPVINSFNITFTTSEGDDVTVKEAGEWTLKVGAGLYSNEDGTESNGEIVAKFTVDPAAPISWTADPANGSKQDIPMGDYTMVTFTFDAESVSYTAKDQLAGIRVKYRGTEIDRVEDVTADGANGYMLYDNYGEPQVIFAFNNSVFSAPGVLDIDVDGGAFTVDGEASPAIKYSVTFGDVKEYSYVFTPESGTEVESLKELTLEFPQATTAAVDEENCYIILRSNSWIYPTTPTITAVEGAEHPTFKLDFDMIGDGIELSDGRYSLTIGEGSFVLDGDQQSSEILASWTLKRTTPVDMTWHAEPTRAIVNEGYGIYPAIMFSDTEALSLASDFAEKCVVNFNDTVVKHSYQITEEEMGYYESIESTLPNTIMFSVTGGILLDPETEGKLTITIPAGAMLVSGEPCPEIEYSWDVVKVKTYTFNVTPAAGSSVKELKDFTVEFVGAKTAEINFQTGFTVRSTDYKYNGVVDKVEVVEGGENAAVKISLKEALTVKGDYMLQIYSGAILLDGCQSSPEVKANYVVTGSDGVDGIEADANGAYTVVSLAGVVVLRDADAEAVRALPAGLYIVNGKKVIIRK